LDPATTEHSSGTDEGDGGVRARSSRAPCVPLATARDGKQRSTTADAAKSSEREKAALTWAKAASSWVARAGVEPATFRFSGGIESAGQTGFYVVPCTSRAPNRDRHRLAPPDVS